MSPMNLNQPVTRWELIDAIAHLHAIDDTSTQLRSSLNNLLKPQLKRLDKSG